MAKRQQLKKEPSTWSPLLEKYWWVGLLIFAIPVVIRRIQDVDLWWHMQIGRGVLANFAIPDLNTFYWSQVSNLRPDDFRFTWLGDVLLHLGYLIGGSFLLQLALLASVITATCLILQKIPSQQRYLALPLAMLMVAATYQLQILRNAAFGILLFALVCWLWQRSQTQARMIWWIVPLLGIWSCIHGSYLLGFMTFALLFAGSLVERIIAAKVELWREWLHSLAALVASFVAISIENPFTIKALTGLLGNLSLVLPIAAALGLVALAFFYFKKFRLWPETQRMKWGNLVFSTAFTLAILGFISMHMRPFFAPAEELKKLDLRLAPTIDVGQLNVLQKLQHGLNNMFWRSQGEIIASLDFRSPFDFSSDLYVWTSLLLMTLALLLLCWRGYGRWALWTAYLPILLLGLGYVRTIGLAGMFATFIICQLWQLPKSWQQRLRWPSLVVAGVLLLALCGQILKLGVPFGLYSDHRVGFGPATFMPNQLASVVAQDWPDAPVFTTIENGGFLLYQWYPKKRVFIDGFVGPHIGSTLDLYNRALAQADPEQLYQAVKVEHALIGLRDTAWLDAFIQSPAWVPVHIGLGGVSFQRCDQALECAVMTQLQVDDAQLQNAPENLRHLLSYYYIHLASTLIERGYLRQALNLFDAAHAPRIELTGVDPAMPPSLQLTLKHLAKVYSGQNSPHIANEIAFFQALNQNNDRRTFELGRGLLQDQPQRGDLYLRMIEAAQRVGNQDALDWLVPEFEALQRQVRQQNQTPTAQ